MYSTAFLSRDKMILVHFVSPPVLVRSLTTPGYEKRHLESSNGTESEHAQRANVSNSGGASSDGRRGGGLLNGRGDGGVAGGGRGDVGNEGAGRGWLDVLVVLVVIILGGSVGGLRGGGGSDAGLVVLGRGVIVATANAGAELVDCGEDLVESNIGTAGFENARGGRGDEGLGVLADAGEVGQLAGGAGADAADDAVEGALGEDGDVLGGDGGREGEEGSGVLHFEGWGVDIKY